jgi:DNA-binding NtrC family response regulator
MTLDVLSRRHIREDGLHSHGKESNDLQAREYGQVQDLNEVQTEYVDTAERRRAEAEALVDARGSVVAAARELGVRDRTVRRRLKGGPPTIPTGSGATPLGQ